MALSPGLLAKFITIDKANISELVAAVMAGQSFAVTAQAPTGYTRQFQHQDWVDFVDPVQAGGDNGFNERFHALESEFDLISGAITSVDNAVNAIEVAPPAVGMTVATSLSAGASIPIPNGFLASETQFFAFVKTFSVDLNQRAGTTVGFQVFATTAGVVTANLVGGATGQSVVATGVAIAKKGGW
jgi:hypothetical protein